MFSYCESVAGRAQVVDRRTFEGLVTRPVVQQICDQIAQVMNNAQLSDRERQDAVGALKRRLPAFCWHAWFDDGVRKNDRAHASGLVMIDLDHLDEPMRVWAGVVNRATRPNSPTAPTGPTPDPSLLEGSGHNCGSVDGEVATPLQEGGDGGGSAAMYLQGHRLMAAHITPSTKGLRLVFERPEGTLSLEDAQAIIVRDLGLKGVDTCTKDLARLSFCVPKGYWLWVDYQKIFDDPSPALPNDPSPALPREGDGKSQSAVLCQSVVRSGGDATSVAYPPNYETTHTIVSSPRGGREGVGPSGGGLSSRVVIPYPLLVEKLQEQLGGVPAHGSRNNFIFAMAAYLRYVCDDDPEWIAKILPTYGENRERWRRTIDSACQRSQLIQMPQIVRRAIENAKKETERPTDGSPTPDPSLLEGSGHNCGGGGLGDGGRAALNGATGGGCDDGGAAELLPPPMPTRLPKLIAHLVKNVPEVCRPAVANAVFPALAAHLRGVKFWLIDGTEKEATFMCVTMAPQSSGKSAVNKPIEYIVADIVERDELSRRREQEWKDAMIQKGANKEKPPRPDDLCVQVLVSDMTNAAFVQRMKDADGRYLYTNLEELDLLRQLQTNGTKDVGKIICLCFDNGKYGQERVGTQSVTARVDLRWNWNAASTIQKGMQFFQGRLVDGTLSRINLCTIVPDASRPFVYGRYDARYAEVLKPYIANLNLARGHVECRQALALARQLQAQCQEEASLTCDDIYQDLAYRAVTIAYLKAMVLYIANGGKWSRDIGEFAAWSLTYDLWCKSRFFGQAMAEAREGEVVYGGHGRRNLLELLPDHFTREEAEAVRRRQGLKGDGSGMLRLWVFRGYVVRTERGFEKVRGRKKPLPPTQHGGDEQPLPPTPPPSGGGE